MTNAFMRTALRGARTVEEVRIALQDGADANAQDGFGATKLMLAAQQGGEHGVGMMRLLVDAGADANKQHKDGWTALMIAAWKGREHGAGTVSYTHLTLPTIYSV